MTTRLTTEQVAELWHCTATNVADKIRAGELVATKPAGRWLITLEAVEAYEKARTNVQPVKPRARRPRPRVT